MPGLLDVDTLGLGLQSQQARLPSTIVPNGWEAFKMGSPSKLFFGGWMKGVCWMTFASPSAGALRPGRGFRHAVYTAREAAPALGSTAICVSPLDARPVSLALSRSRAAEQESENSACDFFPAPPSEDGTIRFSMDPVVLAAFGFDIDFHRDSSTDAVFITAVQGGNAAETFFRTRSAAKDTCV